jgi:murein DD-endopeptidase MepM/ murein hydrolase activator NlpD
MRRDHPTARRIVASTIVLGAVVFAAHPAAAEDPFPSSPTTTVASGTPPATPVPTDAEIEAKRQKVDSARADAERAAREYVEAEAALAELEVRIEALEARIPRIEARIATIKRLLAERAAVLYRGGEGVGLTMLSEMSSTGDLMEGGRIARLADAAQQSTDAQADRLEDSRAQLATDRDSLRDAKTRQQQLIAEANERAQALQAALAFAAGDLQVAEQQRSLQKYLAAVAAQQAAAADAAASARAQRPPGDPAGAALIPVLNLLCPIAGPVTFYDDWGQPRSSWRVHQGTDVFALRGTPNVAIADGVVKLSHNSLGGNALWLHTPDGNAYYYAHLDAYEGVWDANESRWVTKGEVIGYTGDTGNAKGGPVHTHFQIHPGDGGPINPYPLLREMCAVEAGLRPPPPPPVVPPTPPTPPPTTPTTVPTVPTPPTTVRP